MTSPDPSELLPLLQRAVNAIRHAAALQGDGGPQEIAAQEAVHAASRALIDHLVAIGAGHDDLQEPVTWDCNALCMLAGLYAAAGRRGDAAAALQEAEATATAHGDLTRQLLVAIDIADAALAGGAFSRALATLLAQRERLPATLDPELQINPHIKLGEALAQTFNWLGDTVRAEAEIVRTETQLRALQARQDIDAGRMLAFFRSSAGIQLHYQRAMTLLDGERFAEAAAAFDALEPTYVRINPASAAAMRFCRAKIAAGLGDAASALAILDAVRPDFETVPWLSQKLGVFRTLRARILLDAGRGPEALEDAAAGVALQSVAEAKETLWSAHWQHARALAVARHDPMPSYDEAISSLDRLRVGSLGYRLDNLYLRARRPMVDEAVATAVARGDGPRCVRYIDAVKSRFLAAALAAGPPPPPDPVLADRLDDLSAAIDSQIAHPGAQDDRAETLIAQRAAVLERMRLDRGELMPPPLEIGALLDRLRARGRAALQLYLARGRVTALLLHEGELLLDTLDLGDGAGGALATYAANLRLPLPSRLDFDPARLGLDAAALVPSALLERACAAGSLLVSPHGALNILPWAALPFGGQRLFERVPVAIVPNIATIPALSARSPAAGRAALFGDPKDAALTAAERPAVLGPGLEELAALYGAHRLIAPPVIGEAATLAGFRALAKLAATHAEAGDRPMLHLACHGAFEFGDPAGSGLKLADRRLTAAELALRPSPFGEVTMAACSTGVRPDRIGDVQLFGDDLVGLPASLLESGAASVLVSTTIAGAQASQAFCTAYHAHRLRGTDAVVACASVQRALLAEGRHKLRDWIGFTLYAA
ncbi:CHAT domain-containing protein [Labrys okinawensis]|uniref:CHAT domain-containing protein n=1 Tax=Labrys okinawensis TaxID=346911 RepID=UPI0039BCC646